MNVEKVKADPWLTVDDLQSRYMVTLHRASSDIGYKLLRAELRIPDGQVSAYQVDAYFVNVEPAEVFSSTFSSVYMALAFYNKLRVDV